MTGSSYRSRVFGYNFSRIVLIFAVLLLCVYFLTRRDQTAFITCGLLVSLAIFFNVGSANILLHRNIGRPIRLTVKDPEEFLHLLAENSAIRPASHS